MTCPLFSVCYSGTPSPSPANALAVPVSTVTHPVTVAFTPQTHFTPQRASIVGHCNHSKRTAVATVTICPHCELLRSALLRQTQVLRPRYGLVWAKRGGARQQQSRFASAHRFTCTPCELSKPPSCPTVRRHAWLQFEQEDRWQMTHSWWMQLQRSSRNARKRTLE